MTNAKSHPRDFVDKRREKPAQWYDRVFAESEVYKAHYSQSCYYFMWSVIADRVVYRLSRRILEIGCGPGQLAMHLFDRGVRKYLGIDLSSTAIEMAKKNVPRFEFQVADAIATSAYYEVSYDIVVCTEVLEHISSDLVVVSNIKEGKRFIGTVPNFPFESHVRHFRNEDEVSERYQPFFSSLKLTTLPGARTREEKFFILDGIRNDVSVDTILDK